MQCCNAASAIYNVNPGLQISLKIKLRSEAKAKFFSRKIAKRSEAKIFFVCAKRTIFQNCEKLRKIAKLRKNAKNLWTAFTILWTAFTNWFSKFLKMHSLRVINGRRLWGRFACFCSKKKLLKSDTKHKTWIYFEDFVNAVHKFVNAVHNCERRSQFSIVNVAATPREFYMCKISLCQYSKNVQIYFENKE